VLGKDIGSTLPASGAETKSRIQGRRIAQYCAWRGKPAIKGVVILSYAEYSVKLIAGTKRVFCKGTGHDFFSVKIIGGIGVQSIQCDVFRVIIVADRTTHFIFMLYRTDHILKNEVGITASLIGTVRVLTKVAVLFIIRGRQL